MTTATTVKDLAKEYVDTYCKDQPGYEQADLQEAYDDMVFHFLYDLASTGSATWDSDAPLHHNQIEYIRAQFKEYADNEKED